MPSHLQYLGSCTFCYDCSVQISTVKMAFSPATFRHNLYKYLRCSYVVVVWLSLYVVVVELSLYVVVVQLLLYHDIVAMCYIASFICIVCCMCLALLLVLVLYVVTLCTLAWKNGFAKYQSLNKSIKSNQINS